MNLMWRKCDKIPWGQITQETLGAFVAKIGWKNRDLTMIAGVSAPEFFYSHIGSISMCGDCVRITLCVETEVDGQIVLEPVAKLVISLDHFAQGQADIAQWREQNIQSDATSNVVSLHRH